MTESAPEHFNAVASRYAASEVHAHSPTILRLHELLAPKRLDSICDVACGPGHLALSFSDRAARIVGVDAAPAMLHEFQKLAMDCGLTIETIQANVENISLPANSFAAVVSRLAPHHFTDLGKAIREMVRLTKPRGCVAVIDLEGYENQVLDHLNHQIEVLHDASHVRSYTAPQWREFFTTNGLAVEALESGHTELPGGLAVKRWCEIGNTPKAAESKIRALLAAASPSQLDAMGIRPDGAEFYLPIRTLIILGRKS